MLATALRRKFGTPRAAAHALGLDERIVADISTSTEYEPMPNYDRRRTTADRRRFRALDEGEDPVEFIRSLIAELDPEELERLGSGDRRRARDEPPPFPGRPRPGGSMDPIDRDEADPLERWRKPGEDRRHAQDRRRHAYDQLNDTRAYRDAKVDFDRRFPSASRIRVMG